VGPHRSMIWLAEISRTSMNCRNVVFPGTDVLVSCRAGRGSGYIDAPVPGCPVSTAPPVFMINLAEEQ
jgi:hypothetical protein